MKKIFRLPVSFQISAEIFLFKKNAISKFVSEGKILPFRQGFLHLSGFLINMNGKFASTFFFLILFHTFNVIEQKQNLR